MAETDTTPVNRRAFLATAGTFGAFGVAGCPEYPTPSDPAPDPPETVDGEWPHPAYDPGRTGYTPETTGPDEPVSELWTVSVEGSPDTPIVAGGTVFVADSEAVYAFDATDGEERWSETVGTDLSVRGVVDDRLYLFGDGEVLAIDTTDGEERWRTSIPELADAVVTARATYAAGTVEGGPTVVELAPEDGEKRREIAFDRTADPTGILAGDDYVILPAAGEAGWWWVLDAETGDVIEERGGGTHVPLPSAYRDGIAVATDPFHGQAAVSPVEPDGPFWTVALEAYGPDHLPVAASPDRLYVGANEGEMPGLYALDLEDGERHWHRTVGGIRRLVACENAVLAATPTDVRALEATDGDERWRIDVGGVEGLAVVDDLLYVVREGAVAAYRPKSSAI